MKISNSKKQLAQIIHVNGGWRNGAKFAAQGGNHGHVGFASVAPVRNGKVWDMTRGFAGKFLADEILPNWHQTILSRDEYFHLYPAQDAEAEQKSEIRWVRGKDIYATPTAHDCMEMLKEKLGSTECGCDECSAFYSKPAAHAESTIEQLAADYRNAKDYADRKQQEADAAKADADAKLAALVAAGEALGLVLSAATTEPKLVITDVKDLLAGDEVRCVNPNGGLVEPDSLGVVVGVSGDRFFTDFPEQRRYVYLSSHLKRGDVVFVRRPAQGDADA